MSTTKNKRPGVKMRLKESFHREGGGLFGDAGRRQPAPQPTRAKKRRDFIPMGSVVALAESKPARQAESYDEAKRRTGSVKAEPKQKRSILDVEPEATGGDYSAMKQANDGKLTAD